MTIKDELYNLYCGYGYKILLETLIEISYIEDTTDSYIKETINHLENALESYENRYPENL